MEEGRAGEITGEQSLFAAPAAAILCSAQNRLAPPRNFTWHQFGAPRTWFQRPPWVRSYAGRATVLFLSNFGQQGSASLDTARIDIAYRPLRVAWVTRSDDFDCFRKAVRLSHALWGGRFNPIVFADKPEDARELIELFRVDMLMPLGTSTEVASFAATYPHLPTPYYADGLFRGDDEFASAMLLDAQNALAFAREKRTLEDLVKAEFHTYAWDSADPLADLLLVQLGAYPTEEDCPIDYQAMFVGSLQAVEDSIPANEPLPTRIYDHPSVAYLSRNNLRRHYSMSSGSLRPGFFVGDVTNLDDLVTFWNLRAADKSLQFIDRANFARFEHLIPAWERLALKRVAHDAHSRHIPVWVRDENLNDAKSLLKGLPLSLHRIGQFSRTGLDMPSPMMTFGEASTLGVFGESYGKQRASFSLADKPFSGDISFHDQHLVASLSIIDAIARERRHVFLPPYVPELNESLGRLMHIDHRRFRIEPERLGLVIDAADYDAFVYGISPENLFAELFKRAGVSAKPSSAGLLARQLITQLGGVDGGRVFKIPGVRRLVKERGLADSFTRNVALQTIVGADPGRPNANFKDHKGLYIEQRTEQDLTPSMAFAYLVDKGLFRMGADLVCPTCSLKSWTPLDSLKTKCICEFCGAQFDATRQLLTDGWDYRRSGLLGRERNVHGAIPVVLTLQQLHINLDALFGRTLYLPSYELEGPEFEKCEVDFLFLTHRGLNAELIIGECKDGGGAIDASDIKNMRRVAALIPNERFEVYYLLSKLGDFSDEETALAATLNDKSQHRVILLTADELEPFHIYDRATDKVAKESHADSAEDLARITSHLYFRS